MAKPWPEKKPPAATAPTRVLPMELRIGDRLADETGESEVIARSYTTAGKDRDSDLALRALSGPHPGAAPFAIHHSPDVAA
jgi:hypothetical protein